MKRVNSSGYIKLLERGGIDDPSKINVTYLKFEIKAPFLLLVNHFQTSNLGSIVSFPVLDTAEAYLPPIFHNLGPSGYVPMDSAKCNELNTKYNFFYTSLVNFYFKLLDQGVCRSEAALVLPFGLLTIFNWGISLRHLIKFIEENYHKNPEIFGYSKIFVLYLSEEFPKTFAWLKQNRWKNLGV